MQRLFSIFPSGWPGVGLLLLRVSVAAACFQACARRETPGVCLLPALLALCASLCAGALTPLAAVLAAALQLTAAANLPVNHAGLVVITSLEAAALALLGPGAYSVDALRLWAPRNPRGVAARWTFRVKCCYDSTHECIRSDWSLLAYDS